MIQYQHSNGSSTTAKTKSLALFYWYLQTNRNFVPPLESLQITVEKPISGPYDPQFLMLVSAAIEREIGVTPKIPLILLQKDWYTNLSLNNFNAVLDELEVKNSKVVLYENICWDLLILLQNKRKIKNLAKI